MDYILLGAIVAILGFLSVTGASQQRQHGGKGNRTTKKHRGKLHNKTKHNKH
jgi:hypothetical protein